MHTVIVIDTLEKAIEEQTPFGCSCFYNRIELWHNDWGNPIEIPLTYRRAIDSLKSNDLGKKFKPFEFSFSI
jgi:hypothetical protein